MKNSISPSYSTLIGAIGSLLDDARHRVATSVNTVLVSTYWTIGKYIVEYEQGGNERAEYGDNLLNRLSSDLTRAYGRGFSRANLHYMRKLYQFSRKVQTLSEQLTWSHYSEILKLNDTLEMSFYVRQCENERWSVRELKRQIESLLFHRVALSKDKEGVLQLANKGIDLAKPQDVLRDPYVLEFVGLPDRLLMTEGDIESALVKNLSQTLLELGKGFAFIGQQYRFSIAGRHYYVDLVFYNVILKCYCLIDLKRGTVQHEDIGQMNFYLNYFRREVSTEGDNPPIGIVLGANADQLTMELAMDGIPNNLFVSRYQLYLPDREVLEQKLRLVLDAHRKGENEWLS